MLEGNVLYIAFAVSAVFILRSRSSETSTAQLGLQLAFAFYVSRVVALTFFPIATDARLLADERLLFEQGIGARNNFVLFATIRATWGWTFTKQVLGNLALLFPLGLLAPLVSQHFTTAKRATALVLSTSLGVESLQLLGSWMIGYRFRSFDVDDLWLNSLGGLLGVGCFALASAGVDVARRPTFAPGSDPP